MGSIHDKSSARRRRFGPAIPRLSSPWRSAGALVMPLAVLLLPAFPCRSAPGDRPDAVFPEPDREYQVKAVFLLHLVRFVHWPRESFSGPEAPLVIGILGSDPFGANLDDVVRGEKVGGHPIVVARYASPAAVEDDCRLLFVGGAESSRIEDELRALHGRRILTVGESAEFMRQGGMVGLVPREGKVRLMVNREAMRAAHLEVSSKLLRLAELVPPGNG